MSNCKGNTYNIGMGCCVPVLAPIENYYTKYEVDRLLEEIESGSTSGCCITPEEVDERIESAKTEIESEIPSLEGYATKNWVEGKGYLTEHQSLSDYALKSEIPDISGLASQAYVQNYTYDKATIDEKVAQGGTFDPTNYYNKTQVDDKLDDKLDVSAYTPTDLSNYYNKTESDSKFTTIPDFNSHSGNTSMHVTAAEKTTWNNKSDFSGNYNDLTNKPTIPNYTAGNGITINNGVISAKIWCGDEVTYNQIATKDPDTIYLIHS